MRAKSRIVVLGNLEQRVWSKEDKYAPVLSATRARLLVAMAVNDGPHLKQGDCKNAFCNSTLPDEKVTIVRPPKGCPRSKSMQRRANQAKLERKQAQFKAHRFLEISKHLEC